MPAAAVIPAPIAYIKVVAVKKLVVGLVGVMKKEVLGLFEWLGWGQLCFGAWEVGGFVV